MRMENRYNAVISSARMKRISKTRAWTARYKTSGSRATGTSGTKSTGTISKSNNTLLELLNRMNQSDTSMVGEKLAENQGKSYDYDIMRLAAERVSGHLDELLGTGEDSIYAREEVSKDREALAKEISGFVSDYNIMMRKLNSSENSTDTAYARKLKSEISAKEATLKRFGITQDDSGILNLDLQMLKEAELSELQQTFGTEDGFSDRIGALAKKVNENAKEQMEALKKESCTLSSNYSRYGTDSGYYGLTGSRYSAKG